VCGSSDPGVGGIITPFCKTDGLFFEDAFEPESFKYDFDKNVVIFRRETSDVLIVDTSYDNINEYFEAQKRFKEMNSSIQISEIDKNDATKYYIRIKLNGNDDDIY